MPNFSFTLLNVLLLSGFLFMIVLFITLYFARLAQKKIIMLQKNLLQAEINSVERERERIAADLHDSVGSAIVTVMVYHRQIKLADKASEDAFLIAATTLRDISSQIKHISRNLTTGIYEKMTVGEILKKAAIKADPIMKESGIEVVLDISVDLSLVKDDHVNIYRILEELLNNAYKHSRATRVYIYGACDQNSIVISVRDNGIGYDTAKDSAGLGYSTIRNRVTLLDAVYSIDSKINEGTEITIIIPLKPQK
jgi:signal transduction histidine kinase